MTHTDPAPEPGNAPDPSEAPSVTTLPSWGEFDDLEKATLISQEILRAGESIHAGNPIHALLVPEGTAEEVARLWSATMRRSLIDPAHADPAHPKHAQYFPPLQEDARVQRPRLYTDDDRIEMETAQFFHDFAVYAGRDPGSLAAALGLSRDPQRAAVLKGLRLAWELIVPALQRLSAEQMEAARREAADPAKGLLRPENTGIVLAR